MIDFVIRIAELNIGLSCQYDYTFRMCKDYLIESNDVDFKIQVSEEDIDEYALNDNRAYGEFFAIDMAIGAVLPKYDRCLIHGACIKYNDLAYLFMADSGVGKTTHIKLWLDNIDGVSVINGDKPIIDCNGYVYGTPWSGKERMNNNTKAKLAGVVLLSRSSENHIEEIDKSSSIKELMNQTYVKKDLIKSMEIINNALVNVPIYKMGCNVSKQAALMCYKKIIK